MEYIINANQKILYKGCEVIPISMIVDAINFAN